MAQAVLIAAQSGRALAQAARRAGLSPFVADLFGDEDTCALAAAHRTLPGRFGRGMVAPAVLDALDALAEEAGGGIGVVLGSGFEADAGLVAEIALRHRLIAADAQTIATLKDPFAFAALCARFGVPHPEIGRGPVSDPARWLVKAEGGSGGGHIRAAGEEGPGPGHYLQARVSGRAFALNFIATASGIAVLAVTAQWSAPSASQPFRYGGALAFAPGDRHPLPTAVMEEVAAAADALSAATGLRGLASADFLWDGDMWWLTEINPRPGATLDVLDRRSVPVLAAHCAACLGATGQIQIGAPAADAAASGICYARNDLAPVPAVAWPAHVCDRPRAGTVVRRDAPLCTVFATGEDGWAARSRLDAGMEHLHQILDNNTGNEETPA